MPLIKRKDTTIGLIIEHAKTISNTSKNPEVEQLFNVLSSLVVQTECANMIIKQKLIEDIFRKIIPLFKVEKDIIGSKVYLASLFRFIGAYTYSQEGLNAIVTHNNVFEFALFLLETISPPTDSEQDFMQTLLNNILVFLGSASAY